MTHASDPDSQWRIRSELSKHPTQSLEEEGDPLIICLGKFPEPLLNLNLKTLVC